MNFDNHNNRKLMLRCKHCRPCNTLKLSLVAIPARVQLTAIAFSLTCHHLLKWRGKSQQYRFLSEGFHLCWMSDEVYFTVSEKMIAWLFFFFFNYRLLVFWEFLCQERLYEMILKVSSGLVFQLGMFLWKLRNTYKRQST